MRIVKALFRRYKRWKGRNFIRRFGKMLRDFDKSLKTADFCRHERRRIKRDLLKNMRSYADILEKW